MNIKWCGLLLPLLLVDSSIDAQTGINEIVDGAKGNPIVKLGQIPKLDLPPRFPARSGESGRIKSLIKSFAKIERPEMGLSATFSGDSFAPIPEYEKPGAMLLAEDDQLTQHNRQAFEAFRDLVALGPKAIPFLLTALDDSTPTKLVMTHESALGAMWHANELSGNPVNQIEKAVLAANRTVDNNVFENSIESYTVKIGDVCFVALGQIVGRPYSAVRYQPSACIVINSPTHDRNLCSRVRSIWASNDANKTLFDSLMLDYSTDGVFNGKTLDGWSAGSDFKCAAAMRLLYYYPETTCEIVEKLRRYNVKAEKNFDLWCKREVNNGVRVKDLIEAIRWSQNPAVVNGLRDIYERSDDAAIRKAIGPPTGLR